ncbi:2-C-methyl-D-erythritol 2,4-cyclodiphosphate synthase [bacterium]|nr:2-C-methyl-D-erythritol 2,4-cyclodiphosphate synthase [bacterium]
MEIRVGLGYDIHRTDASRPLFLGGVLHENEVGLLGHSDGDALLHAIADALLGATGRGDIGELFPDSDESLEGLDSSLIVKKAMNMVKKDGWSIGNIDAVIVCERPKILPLRTKIQQSLSTLLDIDISRISLKGKTAEKLGPIGEGKALEVMVTILMER